MDEARTKVAVKRWFHCGMCGTCIERREAFHLAGVDDPTPYANSAPSVDEMVRKGWKLAV